MGNAPELIVMLTHNDLTVHNAYDIFDQCRNSRAKFWGFKEEPLPLEQMKKLFRYMKSCGKTTFLEVVAYSEKECIDGAKKAVDCNCDFLLGTTFSDSINEFCRLNHIKYMPFVGKITGRPSVLDGTVKDMIQEAKTYIAKGVYGIDLLGYRYTGDATRLNREFVASVHAPVCIAGSVNSYERLTELKSIAPWAFTIGGAFFENKFDGSFQEQIDKVCEYVNQ
ncbi:hypothetical protein [uncultured Succiniclasticum sp.]|uniref:hypothetical protein n=1 Tax=uncultured Succiniclasticum sp. TaxID=1500547 RepID=UPI0025D8921F|nr:hypothetical protein [uncultured Succiniclasticum sp.]